MKKSSLLSLMICFSLFIISCSSESSDGITAEVSRLIDISSNPIEVGEYSDETYTFTISNPFKSTTDNSSETYEATEARAYFTLTYNGERVTNIMQLDHDNTSSSFNTDLIILSTTCGTNQYYSAYSSTYSYGQLPTYYLEEGQSCQFTYKIAPKAAFMYKNRIAAEYLKYSFVTSSSAYADTDLSILTYEALIEKAKSNNAYQLNETILKYAGKRSEYEYDGIVYREASQGTEENHIFSKTNSSSNDGVYVTETFAGGDNGSYHTIYFLDIDNSSAISATPLIQVVNAYLAEIEATTEVTEASDVAEVTEASDVAEATETTEITASISAKTLASGVNAKLDANTTLLTFYKYNFTSEDGSCKASGLTSSGNASNILSIECEPGGSGELNISLNLGDDEYYREKYLKYDKAYYRISNDIAEELANEENSLLVYLLLERRSNDDTTLSSTGNVSITDYSDNNDVIVRCWQEQNLTFTGTSTTSITGLSANTSYELDTEIFVKYENTYNSDGSVNSTPENYVLVTGDCGGIEIETEFPLDYFYTHNDNLSDVTTIGMASNDLVPYNPVDTDPSDGAVRHNLIAQ